MNGIISNLISCISSNEVHILSNELNAARGKLASMEELVEQALKRVRMVFEEALDLYAEVNSTIMPDINPGLRQQQVIELNKTVSMTCLSQITIPCLWEYSRIRYRKSLLFSKFNLFSCKNTV